LRLFTRAPCTRIRSWLSAVDGPAGVRRVAMLTGPGSARGRCRRGR
jgi:hypothetical protein